MKKFLFAISTLFAGLSASAVKDASECENLTPYWDFTQATTCPQAAFGNSVVKWGITNETLAQINQTDARNETGVIVAAGGQVTTANGYAFFNKGFNLIDFGANDEIKKSLCFNFPNSGFQAVLAENGVNQTLSSQEGWAENVAIVFLPDNKLFANATKPLRCRVELNVYRPETSENFDNDFMLVKYGTGEATHSNDYTYFEKKEDGPNRFAANLFYADGKWDKDRFMVYDFAIDNESITEDSYILLDFTTHGRDAAILVRSIKVYSPYEDGELPEVQSKESLTSSFAYFNEATPAIPFDTLEPNAGVTGVNLTPELDFNTYPAYPVTLAGQLPWNAGTAWTQRHEEFDNFKNGAFCFTYPAANCDENVAAMSKGVSKIDLGGDCGPVAVINYNGSALQSLLREMIDEDLVVPQSETAVSPNTLNIFRKYDPEITGTLTVRIEFNIYSPAVCEVFRAFGHSSGTNYTDANAKEVSTSYFLDESGKWDPTKWLVSEFTVPALKPDNEPCPVFIKCEHMNIAHGALLIRSIQFIDHGTEIIDHQQGVMYPLTTVVHTVGKVEHPVTVGDENVEVLEMIKTGQEVTEGHSITFSVPEQYDLHVKVQHDPACGHNSHLMGQRGATSRADENTKYSDEYVNHGQTYVYAAPAMGHTEILSLKAVNRITAQEYPLLENQSVTSNITTGVEAVGAEALDAHAVVYNLQGVVVDPSTAAPGVYVERRGSTIRKVIVK